MELFDPKQKAAIKRGLAHCQACNEFTEALRKIGAPNEKLEEENLFNLNVLKKSLELAEQFRRQNPGE